MKMEGFKVTKVKEFKYLGSTVHSNGECRSEVKKRVQAGWNSWRRMIGVLCDKRITEMMKGKVYSNTVIICNSNNNTIMQ